MLTQAPPEAQQLSLPDFPIAPHWEHCPSLTSDALVVVGAAALVLFDPEPLAGLTGGNVNFTVIPIQIYFWTSEPDHAWHSMAAAASIALIVLLVAMNSISIILRQHFRRRLNQ